MILLAKLEQKTSDRRRYWRPLKVSIASTVSAEFFLLVVFGIILYPEGPLLNKVLWTLVFCGFGMGATLGTFINLTIEGRWQGWQAIGATMLLSTAILGIACNMLCLTLDRQFGYFGVEEYSALFMGVGISMAATGGMLIGWLLFADRGRRLLDRLGL